MFRTVPLSIARSFSLYTQQWYMSHRFAVCTVKNSWRWTEELSKHVEFYSKNKSEKLVHLVSFIMRIKPHLFCCPDHTLHVMVTHFSLDEQNIYDDLHS